MDRRIVAGGLLAVVVLGAAAVSPGAALERLSALATDPVAYAVAVSALYLVRPLFAWPTVLCSVAVGYGLGVAGLPLALLGVAVTATPPFLATRWVLAGGRNVDDDTRGSLSVLAVPTDRVRDIGERFFATTGEVRGVAASKLAPIPADVATCGAAAAGVSFRGFLVGTLVGELPWTVAAVLVGASAGRIATGGLGSVGLPLAVATGVGALVLLAGPAYRTLSGRGIVVGRWGIDRG